MSGIDRNFVASLSLCHSVLVSSRANCVIPSPFDFAQGRLRRGDPGSFSTPADSPPTTDHPTIKLSFRCWCHSEPAKNPGSGARNGGHSLRRGRIWCSAVEVFTNMFHVKRPLVQENKTRIALMEWARVRALIPSPWKGEDEGEGPCAARDFSRARFKILRPSVIRPIRSFCHPDRSGGTPASFLSFGSFDGGSRRICDRKEQNLLRVAELIPTLSAVGGSR